MKHSTFIILFFITGQFSFAQKNHYNLQKGNDAYIKGDYATAKEYYQACINDNVDKEPATFNLSLANYKLNDRNSALELLKSLVTDGDKKNHSMYWYNIGVIRTQEKNWAEAIDAYKQALRENPANEHARDNLQKALKEMPPPTQPKPNEKNKNKKEDKSNAPRMSKHESEQRLQQLEQKEKELQQKMQQKKTTAGNGNKDW